ncbi:MAG TPA: hypothetical protein VM639_23440 [Dongiaceae bacterium]|nr:hypothetical protein [Dongiaceae bacterium]
MAVDTIPSTPPTAAIHQRTEAAKRVQEQKVKDTADQQQTVKQDDKKVVQERSNQIADDRKAATKAADEQDAKRVDVRA